MSWCLSSFAECVMCDPARYCSDCCLSDCNPTLLGRIEKCELAIAVSRIDLGSSRMLQVIAIPSAVIQASARVV